MIKSKIPINLKNRTVYFTEVSFLEYKNICKMILQDNIDSINNVVETILSKIESSDDLNILEKFEAFIYIRNSILGNELTLDVDSVAMNFKLEDFLINAFSEARFTYNDCVFKTPKYFIHKNMQYLVADYFYSYKDEVIYNFPLEDKIKILNELDIPLLHIVEEIGNNKDNNDIAILNDRAEVNIYKEDILFFMKAILIQDLMQLYEFEYSLGRHLHITGEDLNFYTFPELKIHLNMLKKDIEKENSENRRQEHIGNIETNE